MTTPRGRATEAVVLGGSRGIGAAIAGALRGMGCSVTAASSADVDTSDLDGVERFAAAHPETDVLVLNTGGPPPMRFEEVTRADWEKYHNQLFLGFCILARGITVRSGGYLFLISSAVVKEPDPRLVVSGAYRSAFSSVFKVLSREYAARRVSCVNIAPGPIDTDRTRELVDDPAALAATLPSGRLGDPREIGGLVRGIVENGVSYISGAVIDFDGASSRHVF